MRDSAPGGESDHFFLLHLEAVADFPEREFVDFNHGLNDLGHVENRVRSPRSVVPDGAHLLARSVLGRERHHRHFAAGQTVHLDVPRDGPTVEPVNDGQVRVDDDGLSPAIF